ncbi:NAD(P)/FAD-dependent oxidoreductase [Cupriavidus sp. SS-3]|uniref:NAD(P)/FAD-dependent oxidoreductase n=1 Tax=Cupriavidus sp. SS-3 TaxID=3109596 RepID=UPI002DB7F29D|nr:FAD-dependent oxidoreductase [Cupriavidus sp. SS-3]MEC3766996.1 FAD-dependent oxidoreductase [Cupriavidus sp. SS-3]
MTTSDLIVIGGGLVGTAIAYGAAGRGLRVTVLDEGDDALRASRGNFGLVWVQGKGLGMAPYARWTLGSARLWPQLRDALRDETGIDVCLRQPGGFHLCFSEADMAERRQRLQSIQDALHGDYPFEMLDHSELAQRLPGVGPEVVGASYTPMDGHTNPLKLLRALHAACQRRGVRIVGRHGAHSITPEAGGFTVHAGEGGRTRFAAPRVVLAAGLGNRKLAAEVGLHAPVAPNRGQVLIGERATRFLDFPTTYVRQTDEGTIQLGDSMEDVGFDDGTTAGVLADIARRGVRSFPALAGLKLVRAWGALRVMSPDGYPIYQESPTCPGAFVTTCHSGVTLAAAHALRVAPWIAGGERPQEVDVFTGDRFLNSNQTFHHAH